MRTGFQIFVAFAVTSCAAAWIAIGCAPLPGDDCGSQHNCSLPDGAVLDGTSDTVAGDTGTTEGSADGAMGESATCDAASAPSDAPCVISEAYGVFVSPVGADGNVGTRAAPVFTIGHGMDVAKASGKRVYVCAGSFQESLVVDPSRAGVNVYGGFDCGTWTYSATNRVTVGPVQPGYALEVEGLALGATFQDLEFDAPRASLANPGQSSIAVFVSSSRQVTFERVVMAAGNATDGAAGASAQNHGDGGPSGGASNWYGTAPTYSELNGNDATSASAGGRKACVCGDTTSSTGGQGGAGVADGGQLPGPGLPSYGDAGTSAPAHNGSACGAGGSPAMSGTDGPAAAAPSSSGSPGTVSASGWIPANGVAGIDGQPGQGGGGGGNGPAGIGGGGGGACGGCSGAGGKGGTGGGSSIALLSYQSAVTLTGCTLTANNAGNGGSGGSGEAGQAGSLIGGTQSGSGCPGGAGGSGAGGNGGQGGPGGLSLGIGYAGTAPTFDGNAVAPGQTPPRVLVGRAGAAGTKGLAGPAAATNVGQPQPGADGPAGLGGIAQAVLSF